MSQATPKKTTPRRAPAAPALAAGLVAVTLKKPHTHRGADCAPGKTIEVEPYQAALLKRWGVI